MQAQTNKHDERCPACGRFVERDADGFYDRLNRDDESSIVECFCDQACADAYHADKDCHHDSPCTP